MKETDRTLFKLAELKESLSALMDPKVLGMMASLLDSFGGKGKTSIEQYKFWIEKNGSNCRYAAIAKEFFLNDNASNVAKDIISLYDNWAKYYIEKEKRRMKCN